MKYIIIISVFVFLSFGCISKRDLDKSNSDLHRSVIGTLSKHEETRKYTYNAWGQIVDITEEPVTELNSMGAIKVLKYKIAIINNFKDSFDKDLNHDYIYYLKYYTIDDSITHEFEIGERVALNGHIIKYPWKWSEVKK